MFFRWLAQRFGQLDSQVINRSLTRYLTYAFSEILLIVIGILIALYLDQWNENRKQEQQFWDSIERVYNAVLDDLGLIERQLDSIVLQIPRPMTITELCKCCSFWINRGLCGRKLRGRLCARTRRSLQRLLRTTTS